MSIFSSPSHKRAGIINPGSPIRKRGRPKKSTPSPMKRGVIKLDPYTTRTSLGRSGLVSPVKRAKDAVDQSAKKRAVKSIHRLLEDGVDEEEDDLEEMQLANRIIEASRNQDSSPVRETPRAARDEGALFLDGFEGYFEQHRIRSKTSNNSMSKAPSLEYDEFIKYSKLSGLLFLKEREILYSFYGKLRNQWMFELSQGFNLIFYGFGSKRSLLLDFVTDNLNAYPILVVNGYNPECTHKSIVKSITSTLKRITGIKDLDESLEGLKFQKKNNPVLVILCHNIDGLKDERTHSFFAHLCSHDPIWLVTSVDHVNAPVLWDQSTLAKLNFVWHDATTFESYTVETSFKDILQLGKSDKLSSSKGAKYVLSSLTANSKTLYRILITSQMELLEGDANASGSSKSAIDFKDFFAMCLEEFVTSNEISFRTMLGEFIEHKMCVLNKNEAGTEMVHVPFTYGEMEKLLVEELME